MGKPTRNEIENLFKKEGIDELDDVEVRVGKILGEQDTLNVKVSKENLPKVRETLENNGHSINESFLVDDEWRLRVLTFE